MTEIADDRSWWADVEHLRPGAEAPAPQPRTALEELGDHTSSIDLDPEWHDVPASERRGRITGRPLTDTAGENDAPRRSRAARRDRSEHADDDRPAPRRGRITGRPLPATHEDLPVLRRADAASFADAMDLDGAFGAPVRRAESREIVLGRGRAADELDEDLVDADGYELDEDSVIADYLQADDRDAVPGEGDPDRKTVRITANPGIHAEIAERRKLREIESRRPKSVADRAAHHPDRVAMWAVVLGIFLVLIAASSAGIA
jgi:hypothetical protein